VVNRSIGPEKKENLTWTNVFPEKESGHQAAHVPNLRVPAKSNGSRKEKKKKKGKGPRCTGSKGGKETAHMSGLFWKERNRPGKKRKEGQEGCRADKRGISFPRAEKKREKKDLPPRQRRGKSFLNRLCRPGKRKSPYSWERRKGTLYVKEPWPPRRREKGEEKIFLSKKEPMTTRLHDPRKKR